jgi:esterase
MPFIKTGRGTFFYLEEASSGPVVYLLHGLTAKCQDWERIPESLAREGFHVFSFDMRGHGQSDKPDSGYSPEDHAKDLEVCANALGHDRFHLVGHSTGGRNALFFAGLFLQRALTLTIVDQTLSADSESYKKQIEFYGGYPTPFPDEKSLDRFLSEKYPGREKMIRFEKGQFWKNEDGKWEWNFKVQAAVETQRLGRERAIHDWLPKVACPILFIAGGDSHYVPAEERIQIAGLIPKGRLEVVEKAKHGVFRDNPDGFLKLLVPFLKSSAG